jgi:hypothetical protein
VTLNDYATSARPISAKWGTLAMSSQRFRSLAAPVDDFFCRVPPQESIDDGYFALPDPC